MEDLGDASAANHQAHMNKHRYSGWNGLHHSATSNNYIPIAATPARVTSSLLLVSSDPFFFSDDMLADYMIRSLWIAFVQVGNVCDMVDTIASIDVTNSTSLQLPQGAAYGPSLECSGKSRLIKEVHRLRPSVDVCIRADVSAKAHNVCASRNEKMWLFTANGACAGKHSTVLVLIPRHSAVSRPDKPG